MNSAVTNNDHLITHEKAKSDDGNMSTITPVCSCGWRGYAVAAYNDDQLFQVRRQADSHIKSVKEKHVN